MITERYFPEVILSGAQFDEAERLEFSGIRFELSHLDEWVSRSSTSVRSIIDSAGNKTGEIQIDHKPREKTSVSIDVGELELGYSYDYRFDSISETAIRQRCFIGVRFNEPRCLEDVLKEGTSIQNLVTIGVHSPASFTRVSLSHLARTRTLPNGKEFSEPIKMYAQFRGSNVSGREKSILPMRMFFTFDDIGGLDGMARWLTTSTKFRHAIDSLLSHWYLPTIYTDNRLLNMIVAAEAVERIRRQRQRIDFKRALIDLASIAGEPFGVIVQNVDEWARVIVRIRKENLVHRGLSQNLEGQRMYAHSESLYFLVVLFLLRECGMPEEAFSRMKDDRELRWAAKQLLRNW